MALIKCPHCGHAVADVSYKCPNCGAPLRRVGDTDIFGNWKDSNEGLGTRAARGRRAKKMAERDTFVGEEAEQYTEEQLRQMQEDAKVRAQHEQAMKTDGFAKGYGAAAGYEYGHDAEHGTKKYGYDQNGDPYYDDSYYHAAYEERPPQDDSRGKRGKRGHSSHGAPKTVKKVKVKKQKGRGPLIAIIIILIILLLAGAAFAYYEIKWKPDHAAAQTEQQVTDNSASQSDTGSSDSSGSSGNSGSSSTDKNSEVDNGSGTQSNNSDSTTTDSNGVDQGGTEDNGATGGNNVTNDSTSQ